VGPPDLFRAARRRWLAGDRLDIGALAAELGIGRATAFRWVGSRDQLTGEILWSLFEPVMDTAVAGVRSRGPRRLADACEDSIKTILEFEPLRRFIEQDPEYALRTLTSRQGVVQGRVIAKVLALLESEVERGALKLPLNVNTLAYLIVRLAESFIYADVISGQRVDPADAGLAIELLLSGTVARRKTRPASRVRARKTQ
jgi:AcrR family transcriptional regulator